jgi:hypothetical protein
MSRNDNVDLKIRTFLPERPFNNVEEISAGQKVYLRSEGDLSLVRVSALKDIDIDIIGSLLEAREIKSDNNVEINSTGSINARDVRGLNVNLNAGVAASSIAANILQSARMDLRLHHVDDETRQNRLTGSSVNNIADAGGSNAHDLLARANTYGLTEDVDIMLANIDGRRVTLTINHDRGRVNIDQAKIGESMDVTAGGFKGGLIEHTGTDDNLKLGFNGVNGGYMNDVTIDRVTSDKGVHVVNLDSRTARIDAATDLFHLSSVDLLGKGYFSNNKTSVVVTGSDNASLEIRLGDSASVTSQPKVRSDMSLVDRIASIVNSSSDGMKASGEATEASDNIGSAGGIEYSDSTDLYGEEAPFMIATRGGRIYLMADDNANDGDTSDEGDEETSETDNNK